MKVIALNGSPRRGWNTDSLVAEALKGAEGRGAETEHIHLYDLNYWGCISCFECKRIDGPGIGRCQVKDELWPVLDKIHHADAVILGTPIYLDEFSSAMRALLERLIFQYTSYRKDGSSFFPRRMPVGLIVAMNITEGYLERAGYSAKFKNYAALFERFLGPVKTLYCTETLQTADYGKYELSMFDEAARKKRHADIFPLDLKKAGELGASLVGLCTSGKS